MPVDARRCGQDLPITVYDIALPFSLSVSSNGLKSMFESILLQYQNGAQRGATYFNIRISIGL